jgi:hypothetical protein
MKTNATIDQLKKAMELLNKVYPSVSFKEMEQISKNRVRFTLKAKSKEPGARVSHSGRNLPSASWHAHGEFFDILMGIDSNLFILSNGQRIDINGGNWQDKNIGSLYSPCYFSETSIF